MRVLCVLLLCGMAGVASPSAGERPGVPAWRGLSPEEARLFVEQGVDQPATHLLGQAKIRASGGVTPLRVVVALVDFPDFPADRVAHSVEYFEQLLFSQGELPNRSVAEFFSMSSGGRLELTGEVRGWFTAPRNHDYYTNGRGGIGLYPQNSQRLAEDAFRLANPTINYAHFDNEGPDGVPDSGDDDEIVDGFMVIHAGPGREVGGGGPNDFISVFWFTGSKVPADGVFARFFTLTSEHGNLGVIIHELGHLLGLPDLYDTDGGSFGTGVWSMMSGGLNLENGERPADFDAWSKIELGFANAINISLNSKNVSLLPSASSGTVYRLWREGVLGQEYFLLENRRKSGLDAALPGEGLLLYHVDESITSNRNPNHYRVAVEQADGLFQLENRFNDASVGDDGDPYNAGDAFGRYTIPSSLDYDGFDTYVHVFNISTPDSGGVITADISVNAGPLVEVEDLNPLELTGNGDGLLSPGELVGIYPSIAVSRRGASGFRIEARSLDPLGTLLDTEQQIGTIGADQVLTLSEPFRIQVSPDIPDDPYGLAMELELFWDDAPSRTIPVELGIGSLVGRSDDFETPDPGWTDASIRPTAHNQWTYGATFGKDGSAGYKYGYFNGGYRRGSDAALTSPPILVPANSRLIFDHLVDIRNPDSTRVQAGGVVEISANGGDWQTAFPLDGYPSIFFGNHVDWRGRPIFSGRDPDAVFETVRIDLSEYTGSIRVRFRFFAEVEFKSGKGWLIDNVMVTDDFTPVRVLFAESRTENNDVRLTWELASPFPSRLRWLRGPNPGNAVAVTPYLTEVERGSVLDIGAVRALPSVYWMETLDRTGQLEHWGPLHATAGPAPRPWRVLTNPSRGPTRFSWTQALSAEARLEIFDVRGRLVARERLGPSGTFAWEGRDRQGRPTPPGVYFARIRDKLADPRAFPPLRIVRLP